MTLDWLLINWPIKPPSPYSYQIMENCCEMDLVIYQEDKMSEALLTLTSLEYFGGVY